MPAAITDKFTSASSGSRAVPTTLSATKTQAATSISCAALTGWPTGTAVHFSIYTTTTTNGVTAKTPNSQTDWKGIVSGSTITNLTLRAGTDNGYSIGAIVEAAPTAAWADDMVTGVTAEHTQAGIHNAAAAASVASNLPAGSVAPTALATGVPANKLSNPYKFRVYLNNATSSINGNKIIPFDTKSYDTSSNVDVVTNKGRFTAPVAGYYQFNATAFLTSGGYSLAELWKNGALYSGGSLATSSGISAGSMVSDTIQLASGDYVEVNVNANAINALQTGSNRNYFSGFLVSTT